jgi:hypothetical protein
MLTTRLPLPFSRVLQRREPEHTENVRTSRSFGHLIFDIDLTFGFWNLTFNPGTAEILFSF